MNNKELGEFIASENFKVSSNSLVKKTEEIIGAGADLVTSTLFGLPSYSLLKPFIEGIKDWKTRVELKQIAYFLKEFENLTQSERIEFSLMIQKNEEDFTERLFYYITQLNDKKKAKVCGRIGVAYARKRISESYFLNIISIINRASFKTLEDLKLILSKFPGYGYLDNLNYKLSFPENRNFLIEKFEDFPGLKSQLISLGLYYETFENKDLRYESNDVNDSEGIHNLTGPIGQFESEAYFIVYCGLGR